MNLRAPLSLAALVPLAAPLAAQCEEVPLVPREADHLASFGGAVDIDGDTLVVAAPLQGAGGIGPTGAAFVYERQLGSWWPVAELVPTGPTGSYGASVAVDGSTIAVGAMTDYQTGSSDGAVFLYERSSLGWSFDAKLVPPRSPLSLQRFGTSVVLRGDRLLVGAPYAAHPTDPGVSSWDGAVYAYRRQGGTWELTRTIHQPDPTGPGRFGTAVAYARDLLVVGEPGGKPSQSGAVWIWEDLDGAAPPLRLAGEGGLFGTAVATDGRRIAVGAYREDGDEPGTDQAGRVHVFERVRGAWVETAELAAPDETPRQWFGASLDLRGDDLLVGAKGKSLSGGEIGAAFLYRYEGGRWVLREEIATGQPSATWAGDAVALSVDTAVVGAPLADGPSGPTGVTLLVPLALCAAAADDGVELRLSGGPARAGELFLLFGARAGAAGREGAVGRALPLALEPSLASTALAGVLDGRGEATVRLGDALAGASPLAWVALDPTTGEVTLASPAVATR